MDRSPAARLQLALVACCLAAELVPADAARRASPGERGAPAHVGPRGVLRVRLQSRARPRHGPATPPRSLVQVAAARGGGGVAGGAGPPPKALVGSVFVGTPPQEFSVAFDTGSGNLLLPGKQCISVACLAHRSYDSSASATAEEVLPLGPGAAGSVELSLGAGSLTGHPLQDSVCLGQNGELCATAGLVEATETTDEPFNLLPYDGVLGLGLPGDAERHHGRSGEAAPLRPPGVPGRLRHRDGRDHGPPEARRGGAGRPEHRHGLRQLREPSDVGVCIWRRHPQH
uniref:Peptidase A1 domain-containing protein n=1 Tax=Alexandrium monilatum TaxID=311494 RepID=A0A7S4SQB0_9DINO